MKHILFTTLTLALLSACGGQTQEEQAASQASATATTASAAANEAWITSTKSNEAPPAAASATSDVAPPAAGSLPTTVETPTPPAVPSSSAAAAGGQLAPECESFVQRMSACYEKMPPDLAEPMKATLEQTKKDLVGAEGQACKAMTQEFSATAATLQCE